MKLKYLLVVLSTLLAAGCNNGLATRAPDIYQNVGTSANVSDSQNNQNAAASDIKSGDPRAKLSEEPKSADNTGLLPAQKPDQVAAPPAPTVLPRTPPLVGKIITENNTQTYISPFNFQISFPSQGYTLKEAYFSGHLADLVTITAAGKPKPDLTFRIESLPADRSLTDFAATTGTVLTRDFFQYHGAFIYSNTTLNGIPAVIFGDDAIKYYGLRQGGYIVLITPTSNPWLGSFKLIP